MKSYAEKLTLFLLLLVSFLFTWKYFSRYTEWALVLAAGLTVIYTIAWILFKKLKYQKIYSWLSLAVMLCYAVLMIFAFRYFPVEELHVDRWSVIASFWDSVQYGLYPYKAQSHMGNYPGPMPFYFLLAYPFHALGDTGYLSLTGFILLGILLIRQGNSRALFTLFFLFTSPVIVWEMLSRSTILVNTVLVLLFMILLLKTDLERRRNLALFAIAGGLLLSTRNVYLESYLFIVILLMKQGRLRMRQVIPGGIILLAIFILTFLPFVLPFPGEFMEMNPFTIQSSFLIPSPYILLFLSAAILLALRVRGTDRVWFYNGLLYFFVILVYFIYQIAIHGFTEAFFGSKTDISYFIFTLPFFLFELAEKNKSSAGEN